MLPTKLFGIIPPVVSPLIDTNTLDVDGLELVLNRLIEHQVHGIFILGTTGEGPNLSHRIRKEIIKHIVLTTSDSFLSFNRFFHYF